MNEREHTIFAVTFAAAFVRYAMAGTCGDEAHDRETDDQAALIAGDLGKRAVEAMRRIATIPDEPKEPAS